MTGAERPIHVKDDGDLRKYRTEIPNMIDDMGLNVYEFRLYVHLKRVAGAAGVCWQGTRTLASHCHMSLSSVSAAKVSLAEKGLITITERDRSMGESDLITIVDIWRENFDAYGDDASPVRQANTPVRDTNTPVRTVNTPVREANIRSNPIKNKPIKKEPAENERMNGQPARAAAPADSFIHSASANGDEGGVNALPPEPIPEADPDPPVAKPPPEPPPEYAASFDLLTDDDVGMSDADARYLAAAYSFGNIERQVYAWLNLRARKGKFTGTDALLHRIRNAFSAASLTDDDRDSDLYKRHHPEATFRYSDYSTTSDLYPAAAEQEASP